ncbi:MAG: S8 family serine peptidase, partial [Bacteroidota bacterium]
VDSRFVPVPRPQPLTSGIWTTDRSGRAGYNQGMANDGDLAGDYTNSFGGTSSSCPGVAGVVALMLAANPNLTWQEVRMIIKNSCDKIDAEFGDYDASGHSPFYGYGKINAGKALENSLQSLDVTATTYEVLGVAQFSKKEDVPIVDGLISEEIPAKSRLLAMELELNPFHPDLQVAYQTIINKLPPSAWTSSGESSGTDDGRRKMIGFACRLEGALANQYDVIYHAKLRKKEDWVKAKNGQICGTAKNGGAAIENIKIEIIPKEG